MKLLLPLLCLMLVLKTNAQFGQGFRGTALNKIAGQNTKSTSGTGPIVSIQTSKPPVIGGIRQTHIP